MINVVRRLEQLLKIAEAVPVKDRAGIITAAGIDAGVRVRAIAECLKIAREEAQRETV